MRTSHHDDTVPRRPGVQLRESRILGKQAQKEAPLLVSRLPCPLVRELQRQDRRLTWKAPATTRETRWQREARSSLQPASGTPAAVSPPQMTATPLLGTSTSANRGTRSKRR